MEQSFGVQKEGTISMIEQLKMLKEVIAPVLNREESYSTVVRIGIVMCFVVVLSLLFVLFVLFAVVFENNSPSPNEA